MTLLPVLLSVTVRFLDRNLSLHIAESTISNLELMVFGGLIIFFLIVEPHGLARLWQIGEGEAAARGRSRTECDPPCAAMAGPPERYHAGLSDPIDRSLA